MPCPQHERRFIIFTSSYLTTRELAERWRCSAGHLRNLRSAGVGPAYLKWGRTVRYSLATIERYEAQTFAEVGA